MFEVLKGALTRRLLLFFIALSILPTLAMVVIPLLIRTQEERKEVAALEANLQENAFTTFSSLVKAKTNHYEQRLLQRHQTANLFFEMIDLNNQENWVSFADWLLTNDSAALSILIQNDHGESFCRSEIDAGLDCLPANQPLILNNNLNQTFAWQISIEPQNPFTTLILSANQKGTDIVITYNLDMILNEVPRFGLAPHSTLLLVNDEGVILGYPTDWGDVELLNQLNLPKTEIHGTTLQNSLPLNNAEIFNPENLQTYLQDQQPHVFSAQFQDEIVYFAILKIKNTPINVLLMLPLTDVYRQATFYGASLARVDILPAITQAIISTVGFLLVIFFGALFSLRMIAAPIRNLHDGATAISNNQLNTRVAETGLGEMKGLAVAFNQMANAIQVSQVRLESKQLELENTLTTRVEELAAMNGIIAFTNAEIDLPQKLNGVIQILCNTLEVCKGYILLYDPEENLYLAAQYDDECHPSSQQTELTEIEIIFSKQPLGKLVLNCAEGHPLNLVHVDFLNALSTTIGVLIKNAELQSRVRSITISEERRHLARELHDSVTQSLFSVSLAAEGLKSAIGVNHNAVVERALNLLLDQLDQVRSEMRGLILELRPIELGSQSLEEAILGHAASLERSTNIQIKTNIRGAVEDLPHDIQTGLNRIVQESLSNIARHARADHVSITLDFSDATATLIVKDDGCGFDVETASQRIGAYGLMNIRERSELFGGTLDIKSEKENGTTITVIIPIKENSI